MVVEMIATIVERIAKVVGIMIDWFINFLIVVALDLNLVLD